jgi:hypothetical protein
MVNLEIRGCTGLSTKWCKRIKKECSGISAFLGVPACYRIDDDVICIGFEMFLIDWNDMFHKGVTKEEALKRLMNVICHEADHKAIYDTTKSKRACLTFDLLFTGMSKQWEKNREYFVW